MKRIIYLLLLVVVVLAGCKSSKHLATSETKTSTKAPTSSYLASKLQLTIPSKKGSMSVGGTMKMKTHERVQILSLIHIFPSLDLLRSAVPGTLLPALSFRVHDRKAV